MKVYAVKKGFKTGIFESWVECQDATKGYSGPEFKSFKTKEEAEAYLNDIDLWEVQVAKDNAEGFLVAFTDGSFDDTLKRYSYGVVFVTPEGSEDHICGYGSNEKYLSSKNIIGEIFGVINALDWAVSNNYQKIKIYHDYEGLSQWVSGEWNASKEASMMFVALFKSKYEGLLEVVFEKVPGHSNVSYNDKADQLAKAALIDRKKVAIQGAHWYSIPYFSRDDFDALANIVVETDANISYTKEDLSNKSIYRFKHRTETVTVTLFDGGSHKLLVQGKNTYLFQVIATTLVELDDASKVEQIMGSAYRIKINQADVEKGYNEMEKGFPSNYPENIKRLIRQSIINLKYSIESEEYAQYAFPALRALEGHIKYLIISAGGSAGKIFNTFNKVSVADPYYYTGTLTDVGKKASIERCYNYYKAQRDTAFHFGDILGSTDSTRMISSKDEADEIINKCLALINENI